ncbi:MAG TPA: hypothetical protein VF411_04265, partial [Bacteroidia bacterium]
MKTKLFFASCFLFLASLIRANGDSTHIKHVRFAALPIIYYQPETKWGAGAAGLFRFKQRTEPDSMRHSNIMF